MNTIAGHSSPTLCASTQITIDVGPTIFDSCARVTCSIFLFLFAKYRLYSCILPALPTEEPSPESARLLSSTRGIFGRNCFSPSSNCFWRSPPPRSTVPDRCLSWASSFIPAQSLRGWVRWFGGICLWIVVRYCFRWRQTGRNPRPRCYLTRY